MRRFIALWCALLAFTVLVSAASAQDATPAADQVTPDPAACQVEPRTIETLTTFLATPAAVDATPEIETGTPETFVVPEGEPADAETVAGVTATAHELFACYNANAYLQVFGLFTDEYLTRSFAEEGVNEEALGFFSMPAEARPPEARESVAVRDVQVLADGRVGAFLVVRNPEAGDALVMDYTIFVEQDGRYLIDDVIFLPAEDEQGS